MSRPSEQRTARRVLVGTSPTRRRVLTVVPLGLLALAAEASVGDGLAPVAKHLRALYDAASDVAEELGDPTPEIARPPRHPIVAGVALRRAVGVAIGGDGDDVSVSVLDREAGTAWSHRGAALVRTGSVAKVLIVAEALRRARAAGTSLTSRQRDQARLAITQSDNASADALYSSIDRHTGLAQLAGRLGMAATATAAAPSHWGLTLTSSDDLVTMMASLASLDASNPVLHADDQPYLLGLMGRVVNGQRWGVGTVRSSTVSVRVKNGWMAVGDPWVINSVGDVRGRGRDYVLAIMQRAQPDEDTGITRASRIGRAVFTALAQPLR